MPFDDFGSHITGLESPLANAVVITPNDTTDLAKITRALHLGTGGSIRVTMKSGQVVTFPDLGAGWHPLRVVRVHASGTTAMGLVGAW